MKKLLLNKILCCEAYMPVTDSNYKTTTGTSATICHGTGSKSLVRSTTAELGTGRLTSGDTWFMITAEGIAKNPGNQIESVFNRGPVRPNQTLLRVLYACRSRTRKAYAPPATALLI
jgi:hypothetical protein